jgi:hypothetical protein
MEVNVYSTVQLQETQRYLEKLIGRLRRIRNSWLVMPENFASEYTVRFWCKRLQGGPVTMTASQDV